MSTLKSRRVNVTTPQRLLTLCCVYLEMHFYCVLMHLRGCISCLFLHAWHFLCKSTTIICWVKLVSLDWPWSLHLHAWAQTLSHQSASPLISLVSLVKQQFAETLQSLPY